MTEDHNTRFSAFGITAPDILIPKKGIDLTKWAVVACDQYTSEPEYWDSVADLTKDVPSTYHMILPESFLDAPDAASRIKQINKTMQRYIEEGIFDEYPQTFFLVHRKTLPNKPGRWGLIAAVDLEQYDYSPDSTSLIRATEGTILERIPPRKQIRNQAVLEFPHIIVLIDDADKRLIEPLAAKTDSLDQVYHVDLMKDSGSVTAYAISQEEDFNHIAGALEELSNPDTFASAYGSKDVILFAMGDGNHSLATAKSCWEDIKTNLTQQQQANHPARYALVEIENIYDKALEFEPIHRVLFEANTVDFLRVLEKHCGNYEIEITESIEQLSKFIQTTDQNQYFGLIDERDIPYLVTVRSGEAEISAGTLQLTLDDYLREKPEASVDYTHGVSVTKNLGSKHGNIGLFLPAMRKEELFSTIVHDGALPRKTFSMGEDFEKRFYFEGRRIK